eukprot:CAMPEP_0182433550 /NCGR_PEP_ID=MMETSP1167-20130531/63957_1 /TAXON_ID=2988 /ORGANISM="Mallomonas Sp, Strain CCMP3275" /LENGTH=49 /DNA_ID= /DNA_START= /DNA_END= /DNA_ORIENTATION=
MSSVLAVSVTSGVGWLYAPKPGVAVDICTSSENIPYSETLLPSLSLSLS